MKTTILIFALLLSMTAKAKYLPKSPEIKTTNHWMILVDRQNKVWSVLESDLADLRYDLSVTFVPRSGELCRHSGDEYFKESVTCDLLSDMGAGILRYRKRIRQGSTHFYGFWHWS